MFRRPLQPPTPAPTTEQSRYRTVGPGIPNPHSRRAPMERMSGFGASDRQPIPRPHNRALDSPMVAAPPAPHIYPSRALGNPVRSAAGRDRDYGAGNAGCRPPHRAGSVARNGAFASAIMGEYESTIARSKVPISDGLYLSGEVGFCATQLAVETPTYHAHCCGHARPTPSP